MIRCASLWPSSSVSRPTGARLVGRRVTCLAALLALAILASGCGAPASPPHGLAAGRGENALAEGQLDHARTYLAEALAHDPANVVAWRHACQAWSSGDGQDPTRIIEACEGYLERAPAPGAADGSEDARWDDAVERLLAAFIRKGETAQARTWSVRLRAPAAAAAAEASLWLAEDPARALAALEPVLPADPEQAAFHDAAAAAYEALGREVDVLRHLERSQAIDPLRADLYARLAAWAARAGDSELEALQTGRALALARYEALAEVGPGSQVVEAEPADEPMDDTARNAERLRLLVGLDEAFPRRHPHVRLAKARLEIRLGHLARGRQRLDGLKRQKLLDDAHRLAFAELFQAEEQYGVVRDWLEPMVAAEPGNERARTILLDTLMALNALPAARELLEVGIAQTPTRARFHADLAHITALQGSTAGFERHLRRAIDLSPWNTELRTRLAAFMVARGRKGDARALLAAAPVPSPELEVFAVENDLDDGKKHD